MEADAKEGLAERNGSAIARIHALQAKAAWRQAQIDACQGHIWGEIHISAIDHSNSSSAACLRCGERRAWKDIGPNEQWEHGTPQSPNSVMSDAPSHDSNSATGPKVT